LDHHWLVNRQLWDSLDCVKIQPRLYLYAKIDSHLIGQYSRCGQLLEQQIDLNERLKNSLDTDDLPTVAYELSLQNLLLKIAHAFNRSLLLRRQHDFQHAMDCIYESFKLIDSYKSLFNERCLGYFKSPETLLAIAHYHKGKIHRLLASNYEHHLDFSQLHDCEKSYLKALDIFPNNPVIHSSLGFLYNDLQRHEEALKHHQIANEIRPHYPDFIHGLAYCLYLLENQAVEMGHSCNRENLEMACDLFERAIQLFEEYETQNSRIFLDKGKVEILLGNYEQAFQNFCMGLEIDPHHQLLLEEKKSLNLKMKELAHSHNPNSVLQLQSHPQNIILSQSDPIKRKAFIEFLVKSAEYVQELKGNKRTKIFICYAWHCPQYSSSNITHQAWIEQFAADLEMAGFEVLFDIWTTRKGHEKMEFVEKILTDECDYIIVVGSKLFLEKYNDIALTNKERERVLRVETRMLNHLIGFSQVQSNKVVPVLIEGVAENALPPLLRMKNLVDFTLNDYFLEMSELIRDLHGIGHRDSYFKQLLKTLQK
jgi:tetratricopeptide (TPR) repeat protein